jgi:hypothetical protein
VKWQHARKEKIGGQHRSKHVRPPFLSESRNHLEEVVQLKEFFGVNWIVCVFD